MKAGLSALALLAVAAASPSLAGCGGDGGSTSTVGATPPTTPTTAAKAGKLPPGAVEPVGTAERAMEGPAATEASPEASPSGPSASGELPDADRSAVAATVADYIAALDRHDAARVCSLLAPGSIDLGELPERLGGCRASLGASIAARPRGGGPAWRRTNLVATHIERLSDDRARVSATVTHRFSDRSYVSVEDDVVYLEKTGGRWRLAKPSGTFYRAIGYADPPLRAFSPPNGW